MRGARVLQVLLTVGSVTLAATLSENQTPAPTTPRIKCYACGVEGADPENDVPGSYGDSRKEGTGPGKKMYNHTCDIADKMGMDDKWVRECPEGVRSCFWAKGMYADQEAIFRGCVRTKFRHDPICSRELQAVQIVQGKQSADVEIKTCYCNSDNCNWNESSASSLKVSAIIVLTGLFLIKNI